MTNTPNRGPTHSLSVPRHRLPDLHLLSNQKEEAIELARDLRHGTPMLDAPFHLPMGAGKADPPKVSKTLFRAR